MLDVLALMFFISLAAGFIGALSGLGGGVVLIPLYAWAASTIRSGG
ncbi:MAG: hypothetical protein QXK71_03985 [Pyrobaculum sp.]|jgi:uncharacterized membrane protein YfcA